MMLRPQGRRLGRRPDSSDPKDRHYLAAHPEAARVQLPPSIDLRSPDRNGVGKWPGLPPKFDQGDFSSCGANMGSRIMCHYFPEVKAFSRFQIYKDVREIEGTGNEDAGVETRDIFKTLTTKGAAPEELWPYEPENFSKNPPQSVYDAAKNYRLSKYSRLISGSNYLQCLASGHPFGLGITLYESFESEQTDKTGIMPIPGKDEEEIGGHDITCVGFILNFKSDPLFLRSRVDPALVADEMLICDNSWGDHWSRYYRGSFFIPLSYALDKVTGNDAWTGRR